MSDMRSWAAHRSTVPASTAASRVLMPWKNRMPGVGWRGGGSWALIKLQTACCTTRVCLLMVVSDIMANIAQCPYHSTASHLDVQPHASQHPAAHEDVCVCAVGALDVQKQPTGRARQQGNARPRGCSRQALLLRGSGDWDPLPVQTHAQHGLQLYRQCEEHLSHIETQNGCS